MLVDSKTTIELTDDERDCLLAIVDTAIRSGAFQSKMRQPFDDDHAKWQQRVAREFPAELMRRLRR